MNQLDEQSSFSKEWKRVRLEDVCCPEKNIVSADSEVGESLPYLSLEHIESLSGRILKESLGQIDSQGVSTTYRFDERYVLYGKLRPYLNKVAMPDFAGRCTTELIPLLPDSDIITKDYLAWILRRDETVHIAMSDVTGSRMPRANMDKLFKMSFPLPPLPEQKQIVEKLNKQLELAEQAKKSAEQKLQAAKKLRESLLDNVFPQPENLPTGWKLTKFGDVCEQETGTYNPSNKSDVNFTYIDISSIDCVTKSIGSPKTLKGKDAPSRARKRIFQNDIILSTTRPNLNAVAIVPKEYDCQVCSTGFCVLRTKPELVNYLFLFYYSISNQSIDNLSQLVQGALYPAVTDKQVFEQKIPLPPLQEQNRIVEKLSKQLDAADKVLKQCEKELEAINKLPASLLQRAFEGDEK